MTKKTADTVGYFIRIRSYPERHFVTIWLCRRQGAASSAWLTGEMLPQIAEEIAAVLGLPIERESSPLPGLTPCPPEECVPMAEQMEQLPLFAEDADE